MHNLTPWPTDRYFNMSVHSRHTRLTERMSDFHVSAPFCRTVAYQNDFLDGQTCRHTLVQSYVNDCCNKRSCVHVLVRLGPGASSGAANVD